MAADLDKAKRAEWLAIELQEERAKVKSVKYAVHFHEGSGELKDNQVIEDKKQRQIQLL